MTNAEIASPRTVFPRRGVWRPGRYRVADLIRKPWIIGPRTGMFLMRASRGGILGRQLSRAFSTPTCSGHRAGAPRC